MGGSGYILETKEHSTKPWTQGLTEGGRGSGWWSRTVLSTVQG